MTSDLEEKRLSYPASLSLAGPVNCAWPSAAFLSPWIGLPPLRAGAQGSALRVRHHVLLAKSLPSATTDVEGWQKGGGKEDTGHPIRPFEERKTQTRVVRVLCCRAVSLFAGRNNRFALALPVRTPRVLKRGRADLLSLSPPLMEHWVTHGSYNRAGGRLPACAVLTGRQTKAIVAQPSHVQPARRSQIPTSLSPSHTRECRWHFSSCTHDKPQ